MRESLPRVLKNMFSTRKTEKNGSWPKQKSKVILTFSEVSFETSLLDTIQLYWFLGVGVLPTEQYSSVMLFSSKERAES